MSEAAPERARPYALRPASGEDEPFLFDLYRRTRDEEVSLWEMAGIDAGPLLEMQYDAQRLAYEAEFPTATHDIILVDGQRAGRVIVAPEASEIRFVDLAFLPEFRALGIGTVLIRDLMDDAARVGKPARLHVIQRNRARALYERLGFEVVGEDGPNFVMIWDPKSEAGRTAREREEATDRA